MFGRNKSRIPSLCVGPAWSRLPGICFSYRHIHMHAQASTHKQMAAANRFFSSEPKAQQPSANTRKEQGQHEWIGGINTHKYTCRDNGRNDHIFLNLLLFLDSFSPFCSVVCNRMLMYLSIWWKRKIIICEMQHWGQRITGLEYTKSPLKGHILRWRDVH